MHFKDSLETSKEITPIDSESKKTDNYLIQIQSERYIPNDTLNEKIHEAYLIISKARSKRTSTDYKPRTSEDSVEKYLDLVQNASKSLVQLSEQIHDVTNSVSEQMAILADEIYCQEVPGYYRRNDYPHPWRLFKNRKMNKIN